MPRQDVPYGGAICRLRERIAEIFDKLGEKLHTINGVPGDGDGNVKIVSGSSAVVISNDPTQNEIAVSLDTSQLPAATVSSVNGQTGAVALDAGDIPTVGGDVQADLQDLANDISGNTTAINAEVLARQGADSTLQTNINAVSASLPSAAAAAVAADPTVAYISSELTNKVDLSDVSTVETPDTIAKRNGSGRLVAADPASGATDKTLVTANWVSQTGNAAPNNLIHRSGDENLTGIKNNPTMGIGNVYIGGTTQRWVRIAYSTIGDASICGYVLPDKYTGVGMSCEFYLIGRTNNSIFNIRPTIYANPNPALFALTYDGTNYELWYYYSENGTNRRCTFCIRGANVNRPFIFDGMTYKASLDPADYVYITTPTVIS